MIYLKKEAEVKKIKTAGKALAELFALLTSKVVAGITTRELDIFIESYILAQGMLPACKGYHGYPAASCISINDVVVHGVPSSDIVIKDGDLVKIDVVVCYRGYCADMARGFLVGAVRPEIRKLNEIAEDSFLAGLAMVKPGNFIEHISSAIQRLIELRDAYVVREFVGHGIGRQMHEDPQIPNFVTRGPQIRLLPGMVLAIEPMVLQKPDRVVVDGDKWTARSSTGVWAAHYEDTVVVTDSGCQILTSVY